MGFLNALGIQERGGGWRREEEEQKSNEKNGRDENAGVTECGWRGDQS